MKAQEVIAHMESLYDEKQRQVLMRFFKTGEGEYGHGDEFLGIKVPQTREVVNEVWRDFPLSEVPALLLSRWHEVRLCGLLILVKQFESLTTKRLITDNKAKRLRDEILSLYLHYAEQANNWDLVDLSAPKILGKWVIIYEQEPKHTIDNGPLPSPLVVLDRLSESSCLWEQRMSMVCTWMPIREGDPSWCLRYAERHLRHPHDLIHKAVGWMLREMGKHVSMDLLRDFLRQHIHEMPRTALRYAIEKMDREERSYWMNLPQEKKTHKL